MKKQYGEKKGEEVFYASKNAGTITGVDGIVYDWADVWQDDVILEGEKKEEARKPAQDHQGPRNLSELNAANRRLWKRR
jgi:hypothetical protein